MLAYINDVLCVVDDDAFERKLNSCKVKHFRKLNVKEDIYKKFFVKFNETPRYIIQKLNIIYWMYYEYNETERFKIEIVTEMLKVKERDNTLTLDQVLQKIL